MGRTSGQGIPALFLVFDDTGRTRLADATAKDAEFTDGNDMTHHLAIFLNLTSVDINGWSNPFIREQAMKPVTAGGKLVSDSFVIEQLKSGVIAADMPLDEACEFRSSDLQWGPSGS